MSESPTKNLSPYGLRCLQKNKYCEGNILYRDALSGTGAMFPRCDYHWDLRLQTQERIDRDYPDTSVAPAWFDPAAAGESWNEE